MNRGSEIPILDRERKLTIMVNDGDTRDFPSYQLAQVREAAANKQVFKNDNVDSYMAAMSYNLDDLCELLASLRPEDFWKSHWYSNYEGWFDAYVCRVRRPSGGVDELYIKFRLAGSRLSISVLRFHPTR